MQLAVAPADSYGEANGSCDTCIVTLLPRGICPHSEDGRQHVQHRLAVVRRTLAASSCLSGIACEYGSSVWPIREWIEAVASELLAQPTHDKRRLEGTRIEAVVFKTAQEAAP